MRGGRHGAENFDPSRHAPRGRGAPPRPITRRFWACQDACRLMTRARVQVNSRDMVAYAVDRDLDYQLRSISVVVIEHAAESLALQH